MEPKERILKEIKDYHDKTGGKCGLGMVQLLRNTGYTSEEAKPYLRQLYDAKEIHVRTGLNDKLLMYGSKEKR